MRRRAFTLIELLMVIAIMGIIMAFILTAASGGIRRAEEKATISLIAKLEAALVDRIDALSNEHPEPLGISPITGKLVGHRQIAATYTAAGAIIENLPRAQVISFYDNLRAEMPDVWVWDQADANYPINFGAIRYGAANDFTDYLLPLGINSFYPKFGAPTGIKGASFAAAAGLYSQLGYGPKGTDGADNDGDLLIDEMDEGTSGLAADQIALIKTRLAKHTHKTARSEALYAFLVEGSGPMGSALTREDFTKNEVQDTDGDGLLEFVDAWGEPLQFYRWPVLFNSDSQRGFPPLAKITQDLGNSLAIGPYSTAFEAREVNTLDPNQLLLAPAWWTATFNSGSAAQLGFSADATTNASAGAIAFQSYFHTLIDPVAGGASSGSTTFWDRTQPNLPVNPFYGKIFARRAYYNRFLVLSAGQDKQPGTAMLGVNYAAIDERTSFPLAGGGFASSRDGSGGAVQLTIPYVIQIENAGGKVDPNRTGTYLGVTLSGGRNDTNTLLEDFGNDDITSQNIHALGGPLQ